MDDTGGEELIVSFSPPLYLQRQRWVLDILRREAVETVLDIGCGEGSLLHCLTRPPQSKPPSGLPTTSPFVHGSIEEYRTDLYLKEIHGLDPHAATLEFAILAAAAPPGKDELPFTGYGRWRTRDARWTPLEVSLWEGGFENINEDFRGNRIDAFVASEVIEHLTPALLPLFAPVILGYYRPRLVVLTTPNYTYNQRFSRPGETSPTGYPDPSGRTDRVFRHHDHKFEWTVEEWLTFCNDAASEFGYDVDVGGVGLAKERDPWNRDGNLGFASQVAAFRRRDSEPYDANALEDKFVSAQKPVLRAKYTHLPHPLSLEDLDRPPAMADIRQAVKDTMIDLEEGEITFDSAWKNGVISLKCLGDIAALVRAFDPESLDDQEWSISDFAKGLDGTIIWKKFVMPEDVFEPQINQWTLQGRIGTPTWSDEERSEEDALDSSETVPLTESDDGSAPDGSAVAPEVSDGWAEDECSWGSGVCKGNDVWGSAVSFDDASCSTTSWALSLERRNGIPSVEP